MKLKYKSLIFLILILFCVGSVCATDPNNNTTVNNVTIVNESNNINNSNLVINTIDNNVSVNDSNNKVVVKENSFVEIVKEKFKDKNIGVVTKDLIDKSCTKDKLKKSYQYDLKELGNKILINLNNLDYVIDKTLNSSFNDLNKSMGRLNYSLNDRKHYYTLSELYNDKVNGIDLNKNVTKSAKRVTVLIKQSLKALNNYLNTLDYYDKELKDNIPESFKVYNNHMDFVKKEYPDISLKEFVNISNTTINALNLRINNLNLLQNYLKVIKQDLEKTMNIIQFKYNLKT